MDYSSYRLNFDVGKKNKIYQHSWKEHVKISKIWLRNVVKWIAIRTRFANFVLGYTHGKMHHFQILQFY